MIPLSCNIYPANEPHPMTQKEVTENFTELHWTSAWAQSQQSNATASIQHPHASPKLGCLLLDGRFQGSLVHVQTLQIRHHEEMIWQNRGRTKFAVGWCLHPHRRFNRHGALLHHPEGESGSDGDQQFDDITREKSLVGDFNIFQPFSTHIPEILVNWHPSH